MSSILIVDDLRANLLALESVLAPLQQRVVSARSGQEAIALAAVEEFAVVLMDVQMPVLDGFETVALLRREPRHRALPVIFVTAIHNEREFLARGYAVGAVDYIIKPYEPEFVRAKVGFFVELHQRGVLLKQQAEQLREREHAAARELAARLAAELASRAKDEFLATVSHELRTPLGAILGWVELLQGGRLDTDGTARALEAIRRCGQAQSKLVEDLLDVSRIINGSLRMERRRLDAGELTTAAVETVRALARDRGVTIDAVCEPLAVEADGQRLQQVVWNLVGNAVKFSRRGGLVSVSVRGSDGRVELSVRDQGAGISAELLPHVFERFKKGADAPPQGLGLGLAIAQHIVEAHGGVIRAESAGVGRGATFTVVLPRAIEEAPAQNLGIASLQVRIAAYVYPGWHPIAERDESFYPGFTEWDLVYGCQPRFAGHAQPRLPLWGRYDDRDPVAMGHRVRLAAAHGIDAFIYGFFWCRGKRVFQDALDQGFLPAAEGFPFAVMWANRMPRRVLPVRRADLPVIDGERLNPTDSDDFLALIQYLAERYFKRDHYLRIDGKAYFSIFDSTFFVRELGAAQAAEAIRRARAWLDENGFGQLYLAAIDPAPDLLPRVREIGFDCVTHYVLLPYWKGDFLQDYATTSARRAAEWPDYARLSGLPYFPSVSPGWDASARGADFGPDKPDKYPWWPVVVGEDPRLFGEALARARAFGGPLTLVASFNEWSEGHHVEPDTRFGLRWLEAICASKK